MRDERIDLLRVLGLAMIILAHVNPPPLIFQLRNFDVPLMVLISGMSFGLSYRREPFFQYLWKRIKRLVFPVWVFLSIYFGCILLFDLYLEKIDHEMVMKSYFLIGGISYVWIIKVFLLVALVSPLIYKINSAIKSTPSYLLSMLCIFFLYEIVRIFSSDFFASGAAKDVSLITHYIVPYALIFSLGLRMQTMKWTEILGSAATAFFIFVSIAIYLWWDKGHIVFTQAHKYPPTMYYFSYAVVVSCIAWAFSGQILEIVSKSKLIKQALMFMAENSIWIYLWHIPLLKLIDANMFVKYVLVFTVAVCITALQVFLVKEIILKHVVHEQARKNIKMILTG